MSPGEFLQSLDARIQQRDLLDHPFLRMWMEGTLPRQALRAFAAQYWHHIRSFPTCLSALHARTGDLAIRRELARNLADREAGEITHPEMWLKFAEGIGLTRPEVEATWPLPETRGLVETFRFLSANGPWAEAVAAFYAHDSLAPALAAAEAESLRRNFGLTDAGALSYFEACARRNGDYTDAWRRLLAEGCTDARCRSAAVEAAGRAADALWHHLDGVQHVCLEQPAAS